MFLFSSLCGVRRNHSKRSLCFVLRSHRSRTRACAFTSLLMWLPTFPDKFVYLATNASTWLTATCSCCSFLHGVTPKRLCDATGEWMWAPYRQCCRCNQTLLFDFPMAHGLYSLLTCSPRKYQGALNTCLCILLRSPGPDNVPKSALCLGTLSASSGILVSLPRI